jgi:DNA-binding transcriptional LysR family regulator
MHISRIDLNLLAVFDTIYAEGSITRASRRLNLSQPAISHALSRLRQLVDDPLFMRQGRLMTPTPLARRIIEPVRQSLRTIEATLAKRDPFAPASAAKHFTIGTRDVLEAVVLGALMRNVAAAAPRITNSSANFPPAPWMRRSTCCCRCRRRSGGRGLARNGSQWWRAGGIRPSARG